MRQALLLFAGLFPILCTFSQAPSVLVGKAEEAITVDGMMSEQSWVQAIVLSDFYRNFPDDQSRALYKTEARLLFDDEMLYAFLIMYRNPEKPYSISTLREDFVFYDNDAVGIILDTFNDYINGYGLYVNAYGVRRDEQISGGTVSDGTMDLKWQAEVVRATDHYTVEVAIPLRFIRHGKGTTWNMNIVRNDFGANERSSWVRVPINFMLNNLAFTGRVDWDTPAINVEQKRYSLIPSLTSAFNNDPSGNGRLNIKPSLDAKVSLTTSLNLDVTVNPDFSQAEADQLQVNLTRFELEFPENRFFFVENSDLFSSFGDASWGNPANRPFYSRVIGLRFDSSSSSYRPKDIMGGLRLSGKVNNDLRIGAMSMFTRGERVSEKTYNPAQNYSVIAAQQKVFSRSNVAMMLSSRQSFGSDSSREFSINKRDYNRVLAMEYNFASRDDSYSGKVYYQTLFTSANQRGEYASGILLRHNTRQWRNWFNVTQISRDFKPDAGFVPRTDVTSVNIHAAYSTYPKRGAVNQWEYIVNPQFFMSANGSYADHFFISGIHAVTKRTQDIWIVHIQERIALKKPFDPTFRNEVLLDSGSVSVFDYARMAYGSDRRRKFFWNSALDIGSYYTGWQIRSDGEFNYRLQPHGVLGINYNIGRFVLAQPFTPANVVYVAPKFEYAFTRKVFLTSMVQYRTMGSNLNYFFRFQWRFGSLSDLFIVYSHNRDTQLRGFRDQSLVLKTVIWI